MATSSTPARGSLQRTRPAREARRTVSSASDLAAAKSGSGPQPTARGPAAARRTAGPAAARRAGGGEGGGDGGGRALAGGETGEGGGAHAGVGIVEEGAGGGGIGERLDHDLAQRGLRLVGRGLAEGGEGLDEPVAELVAGARK